MPITTMRRSNTKGARSSSLQSSSSSPDDDGSRRKKESIESDEQPDYSREETLLKIHLATQLGVSTEEALDAVAKYSHTFPFSTILPLKPLLHMPVFDDGVEIQFLRRGGRDENDGHLYGEELDGGLRFFFKIINVGVGGEKTTLTFSEDDEDEDDYISGSSSSSSSSSRDDEPVVSNAVPSCAGLEVTVKRNSVGQSKPHGVAERALVTAYLAGLTGKHGGGLGKEYYGIRPPTEQVYVTSFYHKWMWL
jgi:hypothetical protein